MLAIVLTLLSLVLCDASHAYVIGDSVKNECFTDENDKKVCLDDFKDTIRVLVYNAGWCGPCNKELADLATVTEFDKKPVTFISISGEGYSHGAPPDGAFLKQWRKKHGIPFEVWGQNGNFGKGFNKTGFIPFVAILTEKSKLSWTATNPTKNTICQRVRNLLP